MTSFAQPSFVFDPSPELPCRFGNLRDPQTVHHCRDCEAETERGVRAFAADVAAGIYTAQGYTPAEAKRRRLR